MLLLRKVKHQYKSILYLMLMGAIMYTIWLISVGPNIVLDDTEVPKPLSENNVKERIAKDDLIPGDSFIQTNRDEYDRDTWPAANYNVHIFYYMWYGNPEHDGKWLHWNHRFLPHWDNSINLRYPNGRHEPPADIGANFYPKLGTYSSADTKIMHEHMYAIRKARIGVIAVSWYPNGQSDEEGKPPDRLIPQLLDIANMYDIKVCFHVEPFRRRNAETLRQAIVYIVDNYGKHPALYRRIHEGREKPLFYMYDSYQINYEEWDKLFSRLSQQTVRETEYDGIFIGLAVDVDHPEQLYKSGFDGIYTYFASDTFVYGSTPKNWPRMSGYCKSRQMLFIPSVGPGYIDTEVRPWNFKNTKDRNNGTYYRRNFKMALTTTTDIVSITSFNEWHEGTQIESAVPHTYIKTIYQDYGPDPDKYLKLTKQLIESMPGVL